MVKTAKEWWCDRKVELFFFPLPREVLQRSYWQMPVIQSAGVSSKWDSSEFEDSPANQEQLCLSTPFGVSSMLREKWQRLSEF